MATTTDGTLVASMEEQNPASVVTEEEPPKKAKLATATTNEAVLAPLVDENLASMEEEAPKKVEMLAVAEEGKETFKKVMVNDEEKEMKDVGSEGKGRSFAGLEVMNSEAEGDTGVNNGEEVEEPEEDSKGRSLDAAGTMNYDANEVPALQDTKVVVSMLELAPMPIVRSKLENGELGEDDVSLVSPNVYEGEEGGELREEQQKEEEVAVVVEAKVADNIEDDTESVVDKVKLEPKSEKVKEVKSGGMDGGKSSEVKEVDISIVTIKVVEPEDRLSSFAELNVKYGYQKEASDDPMIMGCEEGLEGSTEQDVDVPTSEASKVIVNDGSIKEFALASADNVLEDIPGTEQNAEGQAATNEVVEDVGGEKLSKFENIVATVEEVGVKKHIEGMKNDVSGELEAHKTEVVISMVELTQIPAVESKLEDGELREEDALLASHDVSDGKQREKVGAMVQAKVADKVENNADSAMAGEKKAEPDGEKVGKVESRDQDGGKLDEEKETKVSIFSVKTAEQEDKLAPFDKDNGELSYRKEASDDIVVVGGEEAREESIERDDNVPMNEVSIVAINDRSIEEVFPRSANNMLEDSLGIEKNDEGQTTTNEVAEVVGVKKPLEFENIADMVEDIGIEKRIEVENIATVVEDVDIERHTEAVKDDANRELETQDTESVIFVVELTPMPTVGSKSEKGELWGLDASLNSPNSSEGKKIDELQEKKQEEEVGGVVQGKITNKLADDAESAVVEEENLELKCEKVEEVGFGSGDGGKLGEVKEVEVSIVTVEVVDPEDNLASFVETNTEYGYQKESSNDTMAIGGEEALKESTEKDDVYVPTSEASTVVINDGSIEEVVVASADSVLKYSPGIEQNVESQATANEVVEDVGVEKSLEFENIINALEEVGVGKHTVVENVADIAEGIDVKKHIEIMMDDVSREQKVQDVEVIISVVEPMPTTVMDSKLEDGKLGDTDASLPSPDALEDELRGEFREEERDEEAYAIMEVKVMNKVADDAETALVEDEKLEPEGEKVEEVGFGDRDGGKLDEEKKVEVSIVSIEATELEDKLPPFSEANAELSFPKESSNDIMAMRGEEALEELIQQDVDVPTSEASIVVVNDGSTEEVVPASVDIVLEDIPWIQQNAEGQATVNEVANDIDVDNHLEFENLVGMIEDFDVKMHKEVGNDVVAVEVVDVEKHTEVVKDDVRKEPVMQDIDVIISMVEPVPIPAMESNLQNSVLGEGDASLASPNAPEGDKRGELWEEEEVGVAVHARVANKVADIVESAVVEEKKPEPKDEKAEEVGSICGDGSQLGKERMVEVSVVNIEAVELEDKLAPFAEANAELGYQKQANDDVVVVGGEEALKESIEKIVDVPTSEASTVVVNEGCIEETVPASTNSVLEDSLEIEKYSKNQVTANKVVEDVGVEKPSEVENAVVIEDVDVKKYIEVEHVAAVEGIDVEKLMKIKNMASISVNHILSQELAPESSKKNNDAKESECSNEVIDHEKEVDNDSIIKAVTDEDGVDYEAYEYNDGANSDTSPALIAILESAESTKQIMKEFTKGSSNGSMDGQNMPDDSKEDDDNDDGDKQEFVSAALTALLEGETSGTSYGNITLSSHDGSEILTMDGPARPGSSIPSLMPTAPCLRARSNTFSPTELAVTANPAEEMTEEEKNLHDKVELIRVKFLRLVYRLGATFEEIVTSLVLYRLSLVEGIMHVHGRHTNQDFSLDNAWKKALILEAEGKEDLNFSCNILVLGKTGVGKSATINSIFGEDKSKIDAFSSATTSVREYVGDVHGIKIRIIDTPGFQTSVMDQGSNRKILAAIKKYTKKCPPDIILYVDRLDSLSRDHNDLPLLKTITSVLGSSVWFNAIVALTHAASAPPEGLNGAPVTYEVLMAQRSHVIHQSIRQAAGDMCLMNPIALVENHPSCKRNHEGHKVLPNGQSWRHQMLFLCYSSKILCEANSLLKFQDPNPRELFGFHFPTLPFMLSSLMQSRAHPKLSPEQGGKKGDFHIKLDEYFNVQQDDDGENNDRLPPFKPLTKAQLARLTRKQKKQWKNEICKLKEMKKRGGIYLDDYGYANIAGENDHDPPLDNVSVPLPNIVLPPSFDCDNPTYRYRFLEPTSTILARPILDANGWDHDYGYDGVSMEETLAILDRFPANVAVQVTKDKKEFSIHLDSSIAIKHGENASSLAGFDIQTAGQQPAYILRGETKIKNIKKNETTGGFSVTFLGDTLATGLKVENQLSLGNRLSLVASTGAMQAQGDTAYGANLEACLKDKHYPIGQSQSTLGLSLMKSGRDLALDANLQSQFSIGRGSKMALRLGLNNKLSGQITVRTSTSDQVQIALLGLVPVAASIYRSFRPTEPSSV